MQPNSIGPFQDVSGTPIEHDAELLDMMLSDMAVQDRIWRPTKYWMNYVAAKRSAFSAEGMANLRRNFEILNGFAEAGAVKPALPLAGWKRALWKTVERLPVANQIVASYRQAVASQYSGGRRAKNGQALLALDVIAADFPDLRIPEGQTNGAPLDIVRWRDRSVAAEFVDYLTRVADVYRELPPNEVTSVVEVGPGLGWTTLAHVALNPGLQAVVNIDIPPILYVSTQFLKSMPDLDVLDYRTTRDLESIIPKGRAGRVSVIQIAPWQVPSLQGPIDLLANAFSFYEMELDVCRNYARHLVPLLKKGVLLHSSITGKAMSHGPAEAISMDFLAGLFAQEFPQRKTLAHGWNEIYGRTSTAVTLLTR